MFEQEYEITQLRKNPVKFFADKKQIYKCGENNMSFWKKKNRVNPYKDNKKVLRKVSECDNLAKACQDKDYCKSYEAEFKYPPPPNNSVNTQINNFVVIEQKKICSIL